MFFILFAFIVTLLLSFVLWGSVALQIKKYKTMYNLPRKFLLRKQGVLFQKQFVLLLYLSVLILSFVFFASVVFFAIYK
jgi:hypothetical protein